MTFSICVREEYEDDDGNDQTRFGVAVTTRLPGVGTLCPFASENGAVATQSLVNVDLGRKGIEYIDDGLAVDDALQSLLNADEGREQRQLHGVDAEGTFAFSGDECNGWYGHIEAESYTVAGNLLVGEDVVEATADAYESNANGDAPLAERLVDALEAGHAVGGDKREELPVQSAALLVTRTEDEPSGFTDDLRVDATETPVADLRETYEEAKRGYEIILEQHEAEEEAAEEPGDSERSNDVDADSDDESSDASASEAK
ncbi:hypothetical protein AUR64_06480 [Haloprofundus marisrubri]|uniref:DUF1028 domain-containing protein n=1 Tax=Haloprofundus marisrubri TaxID=1514971 RepID=A0A0W1RCH2_9EURY|nr:DUF1028 domain-containing protein [Haloprofundus marisrubri]KTG10831.1 hypothetical protein AUR64_06480 [Haloprofundus marisrubri]